MVIEKVQKARQKIMDKLQVIVVHAKNISRKNFTKEGRFYKKTYKEIKKALDEIQRQHEDELKNARKNIKDQMREKIKHFSAKHKEEIKKRNETLR